MSNGFLTPEQLAPQPQAPQEIKPASPSELSSVEQDKQALEQIEQEEARDRFLETEEAAIAPVVAAQSVPASQPAPQVPAKDEVTVHVEQILEEGLEAYFQHLPQEAQAPFRQKGQEVAREITGMIKTFHLKVQRAVLLIRAWLKTIPGVNAFFLEQEAKIKTDQLLAYQEELRHQSTTEQPPT